MISGHSTTYSSWQGWPTVSVRFVRQSLRRVSHCYNPQNCLTARIPHRASLASVCIKSRASDRLQQNPSTIEREAKKAAPTAQATRAPLASLNCSLPRRSSSSPASSCLSPSVTWPSPLATCLSPLETCLSPFATCLSPLATCLSPSAICLLASLKPFPLFSSLSANTSSGLSFACFYFFLPSANSRLPSVNARLPSANSRLPASNFALPASNFALS